MSWENRISIYTPDGAEFHADSVGKKYRPSNGTEGEIFFSAWCRHCQRDKSMREGVSIDECDDDERCDIIARTFMYDEDAPEYPQEWQIRKDGQPCCTAFVEAGQPIPGPRCKHTVDMFGAAD